MKVRDEIIKLIQYHSGTKEVIGRNESISEEYGLVMDDFHEFIEDYAEKFCVDMKEYLWYFHAGEEGVNIGRCFFKAPYDRVNRISVTPIMLEKFARSRKWDIDYPSYTLPKHRYDIIINIVIVSLIVITLGFKIIMNALIWFMMP